MGKVVKVAGRVIIITTRPKSAYARQGLGWDRGARIQFVLLLWSTELPLSLPKKIYMYIGKPKFEPRLLIELKHSIRLKCSKPKFLVPLAMSNF